MNGRRCGRRDCHDETSSPSLHRLSGEAIPILMRADTTGLRAYIGKATEVISRAVNKSDVHVIKKSLVGQRTPFKVEETVPRRGVSPTVNLAPGSSAIM